MFKYPDSSCIYVSDFFYSNNEQNISLLGDSIYKLRFQNVELVKEINALITDNRISVRPDTMNLMGKQKNQLIWKDISMKDLSIGYFNVPSSMIEIFNKSISSLLFAGSRFMRSFSFL